MSLSSLSSSASDGSRESAELEAALVANNNNNSSNNSSTDRPIYLHSDSSFTITGGSSSSLDLDDSSSSPLKSSARSHTSSNRSSNGSSSRHKIRRVRYFNDDLEQICALAMESLGCPIAGIRTDDFELVQYLNDPDGRIMKRDLGIAY